MHTTPAVIGPGVLTAPPPERVGAAPRMPGS